MRALLFAIALLTACSGDEREPIGGGGNPAADYCVGLGYTYASPACVLPDGTSCEAFAFFEGMCGQSYTYCEQHGGTISTVTETLDAETLVYGECTTSSGATCDEETYFTKHHCS